jgi:hypothetical protein
MRACVAVMYACVHVCMRWEEIEERRSFPCCCCCHGELQAGGDRGRRQHRRPVLCPFPAPPCGLCIPSRRGRSGDGGDGDGAGKSGIHRCTRNSRARVRVRVRVRVRAWRRRSWCGAGSRVVHLCFAAMGGGHRASQPPSLIRRGPKKTLTLTLTLTVPYPPERVKLRTLRIAEPNFECRRPEYQKRALCSGER